MKQMNENKLRSFWGNFSVSKKFFSVMIATVIFMGIIPITISYLYSSRILRNNIDRNIENTMNETALNIDFRKHSIEEILYDLSTNKTLQLELSNSAYKLGNGDYSSWETDQVIKSILIAESLKNENVAAIYVYDSDKMLYAVGDVSYYCNDLFNSVSFDKVEEGKGSNIWFDPVIFSLKSTRFNDSFSAIPVAKLIYNSVTFEKVGYLIVFVRTDYFYECIEDVSFYSDDVLIISNDNKVIITGKNIDEEVPFLRNEQSNTISRISYRNQNCYLATWGNKDDVFKLTCITKNAYRSPYVIRSRILANSMIFLVTVFAFLMIKLIVISVSNPIKDLTEEMKLFSHGDFSLQVSAKYNDEVGILRKAFNQQVNDIRQLVDNVYREKELKQQAQIKMLQMQINPHFLYNSLDTINWLAVSHGDEDISEVSMSIGYLMRYSLLDRDIVPFEEELDAVEHYFLIQKYRFGEQLKINYEISDDSLYEMIPPHIMLPIIENSFNHGLKEKEGEKYISITAEISNEVLHIRIADNGTGMDENRLHEVKRIINDDQPGQSNNSIGLRNVNQRLILKYGADYGLRIDSDGSSGTKTFINVPCNKPKLNQI